MSSASGPIETTPRVGFLYSPESVHGAHLSLAASLGANRIPLTGTATHRLRNALRTAWTLSRDRSWDVLLCELPYLEASIVRLLTRRPRVLLTAIDPVYLRLAGSVRPSLLKRAVFMHELLRWDGYVTLSLAMEWQLHLMARRDLAVARWWPPVRDPAELSEVSASQSGPVVAIITGGGHAAAEWRVHYKGLDQVAVVSRELPEPVDVFGNWDSGTEQTFRDDVRFRGFADRRTALAGALCMLHLTRRESFGVAVVEAMLAGVPVIVSGAGSEWLVAAVEPRLVVQDAAAALARIRWLRSLPAEEYASLSQRLQAQAQRYCDYANSPVATTEVAALLRRVSTRGSPG